MGKVSSVFDKLAMGKGNINKVKGVYVSWYPPPKEWLKLNSDGSICWRNHTVSWGVLSRDLNNKLVHGFVVSWRMCSILQAEIWALWERIKLTISLDIQRLYIECNNILAMQMINGQIKANATSSVVSLIRIVRSDLLGFFILSLRACVERDQF